MSFSERSPSSVMIKKQMRWLCCLCMLVLLCSSCMAEGTETAASPAPAAEQSAAPSEEIDVGLSPVPSALPATEPTEEATPELTPEAAAEATPELTPEVATEPTEEPTPEPTPDASPAPTEKPTAKPTDKPTAKPTPKPTATPKPVSKYALPIDFTAGKPPLKSGFTVNKNGWSYKDPSISVKVVSGRAKGVTSMGCEYWVATIKIADASQLRTVSAKGFNQSTGKAKGTTMAKRVNAVLAINGDYFNFKKSGYYVVRQGREYLDVLDGSRDVLLIDEDGDFHGITAAKANKRGALKDAVKGKKIINAFYFGPLLVMNGKVVKNMPLRDDMAASTRRQRMAIAQVGPLEYKCICCGPPARGSEGMTLKDFAALVAKQNVKVAYNLDGGDSAMIIFNGEKINDVRSTSVREIVDIIYFASGYEGK